MLAILETSLSMMEQQLSIFLTELLLWTKAVPNSLAIGELYFMH